MKFTFLLSGAAAAFASADEVQDSQQVNPLGKVFQLMASLDAKIRAEGEAEAKSYKKFAEWCEDVSSSTSYEIKTYTEKSEKLQARIGEATSDIEVGTSKIEDLSSAISTADEELSEANSIREKEAAEFKASEKELMSTVNTLERATGILEKQMAKGGAAFAQVDTSNMQKLLQTLSVVVDAAGFASSDRSKLMALVQSSQSEESDSDDAELGAPAAATHQSKSGGVLDLLEDLKEKAEGELADARKAEATAKHNHAMLKQSLEDKLTADGKDMADEKVGVSEATETKAVSTGELEVTMKALANSKDSLKTARDDCMRSAADHEATVAARAEELKVIAQARKILEESTNGGAASAASLLQVKSSSKSRTELVQSEVLTMIKKMAHEHHSAALSQLSSRISAVVRYGGKGDPFKKVRGLITDMLAKLQKEAEEEATEKAYCDEEMSKTEKKKDELGDAIEKLTSKIDKAAAQSAELKEDVAELQSELAALNKGQAEMDTVRRESNADYLNAKTELTAGLEGVRKALGVLRDYYGGESSAAALLQDDEKFGEYMQQPAKPQSFKKSGGAGGGIINILEVVESDFATGLAKTETQEGDEAASYEEMTQKNKLAKTAKEQDVKYKTKEAAALDKSISELSGDRDGIQTEEAAVLQYYAKLRERCVAKPDSYEEKKARRDAEIKGLKEALETLESESAFIQRKHKRGARFMQHLVQ